MWDQQRLRSACAYAQSDQSLCKLLEYSMTVKLLTEQHLEFLSLKGGCTGSSESTLVEIPHCWKSHVTAQMIFDQMSWIQNLHHYSSFCTDSLTLSPPVTTFVICSSCLLTFLGRLYCKQYGPRSDLIYNGS